MKLWQYILLGLAVVFIGIQFVPNELPAVNTNNPGDLVLNGLVSEEISTMLKTSCYSCHSNETVYPWYSYVAPSSWLVDKDVREAREEVNFSDWMDYDMMDKLKILDDIAIEVKEGRMPMEIYTLMHSSAKLDDAQRAKIVAWAEETMDIVAEEEDEED
ncbi:heme-binding domain-containing protein [Aquiflexum sp. TKW24L]|uniref:heme-binding domain-containing protein n=1 Tax=Aquiflexum sp. TKW24L TaxID=2942212 RepID=UPI0020C0CBC5|nr:heme-binding domain-containing protein [Aquiflexum sp. TKW24L]MCL6258503.1 heme-binding domain-containing protein [Aquiflexum sp. TKW24L]